MIRKILIANRGEIAVRIIRTARRMGIPTVAVYSLQDKESFYVSQADESHFLEGLELSETYLNITKIIEIARTSHCDAIHPGYGFLSENAAFVKACEEAGLIFIGPRSESMEIMGNKIRAREFAQKTGVPVTAGVTGTKKKLMQAARFIPFPLLLKAAAGGGGKGMQIVQNEAELEDAIESTSRQALAYFGDDTVYIEQYIEEPRHIEIQVLGDHHGRMIHLYERECSIQRRYQKIIEESPSPTLTPEIRVKMGQAAVTIAREIGYNNAGTIEFLVDKNLQFYFLEMNTRIQVEHPVTEMVTGIDIVEEQICIASGYPLRLRQEDIHQKGHAIECRIYSEDPANNFLPSPGRMTFYREPDSAGTRIDTGINGEAEISSAFDPMISKLIVHGSDREEATRLMITALNGYIIHGIQTNISYLLELMQSDAFSQNQISTKFCDEHTPDIIRSLVQKKADVPMHIPVIGFLLSSLKPSQCSISGQDMPVTIWTQIGYWRNMVSFGLYFEDLPVKAGLSGQNKCSFTFELNDRTFQSELTGLKGNRIDFRIGSDRYHGFFSNDRDGNHFFSCLGQLFVLKRMDFLPEDIPASRHDKAGAMKDHVTAPMPGKVIKISVAENQEVKKGETLLILEAMKMENAVTATHDVRIRKINVIINQVVEASTSLVEFETIE